MNAERLLELYEQISEAPDAIARLRRFVLDLAVRGKLVEQDASDEPAHMQLTRVFNFRSQPPTKGRKGKKKLVDPTLTEISFDLPEGWEQARLSELLRVVNGRAYKKTELLSEGTPVLRVGNLFTSNHWYYSDLSLDEDKYCDAGDLIYAWSASFGPFIWSGPRAIYHYHIWKLPLFSDADLSKQYIYLYLLQKTREIKDAGHGISMIHMTKEKMEQLAVPLPPLAEQHRIVAKVDELMALCDRLEEARKSREETRDKLTVATLARLTAPEATAESDTDGTNAPSGAAPNHAEPENAETGPLSGTATAQPSDFPTHARFAIETLPALTSRPDQIKSLRQTILNLAFRGKLLDQNPADRSGVELMATIASSLSPRKFIRVDRSLIDFTVPQGWDLQCLDAITQDGPKNGLSPVKTENPTAPKAITLTATTSGQFDGRHFKRVDVSLEAAEPYWLQPNDLLFQRGNTPEYVGMAAVYNGPAREFLYPDLIIRVRIASEMDLRFVHLWCISPVARNYLMVNATGAQKTMPKINQGVLKALPIPIPPLAEQHRIVAKVDALMALCDRLETALTTADTTRTRLLEALLHEALEPAGQALETTE